jgi:hypothetical protein
MLGELAKFTPNSLRVRTEFSAAPDGMKQGLSWRPECKDRMSPSPSTQIFTFQDEQALRISGL